MALRSVQQRISYSGESTIVNHKDSNRVRIFPSGPSWMRCLRAEGSSVPIDSPKAGHVEQQCMHNRLGSGTAFKHSCSEALHAARPTADGDDILVRRPRWLRGSTCSVFQTSVRLQWVTRRLGCSSRQSRVCKSLDWRRALRAPKWLEAVVRPAGGLAS